MNNVSSKRLKNKTHVHSVHGLRNSLGLINEVCGNTQKAR